jgi:predicted dienelactone hydrolase
MRRIRSVGVFGVWCLGLGLCLALCLGLSAGLSRDLADARVHMQILALVDQARHRQVPVAIYTDPSPHAGTLKPAIISHGHGVTHTGYSFIANHLALHGYYVASIQHEVPDDAPLPSTGNPYETLKPSWERGVQNILFVIGELKRTHPELDYAHLLLIGHSHGGDTSMLFAQEHPALVHTVISLDSRRMPWPRTAQPRICSIRSSGQPADDHVVPSAAEQAAFGMQVVRLPATIHNDMWDGGTEAQKAEILQHIDAFLRETP